MNLKFLPLPESIINIIGDYASEDYKLEFKKTIHLISFAIPAKPGEILKSEILDKINNNLVCNNLEKHLDLNNSNEYLNILAKCNCCKLHNQKKPLSISNWNGTPSWAERLDSHTIQVSRFFRCRCPCRHLSRHICRATVF
jgi:hypothetical protein|tara:strand:+ start:50 stop:472 length:423 start_codon:yes stop_codon:yes gene_type:complete